MHSRTVIREYLIQDWLNGEGDDLPDDAPLLELNVIDSIAIFEIVQFLQDRFDVVVPVEQLTPENFRDVRAIANLVDRLAARTTDELPA